MSDPEMTTFNDLTSLKYKTTVGPIESAMREQRIQDGDLMNVMSQEVIDMEAFLGSGKPVVPSELSVPSFLFAMSRNISSKSISVTAS